MKSATAKTAAIASVTFEPSKAVGRRREGVQMDRDRDGDDRQRRAQPGDRAQRIASARACGSIEAETFPVPRPVSQAEPRAGRRNLMRDEGRAARAPSGFPPVGSRGRRGDGTVAQRRFVTPRGETRVLVSFAGRLVTLDQDGAIVRVTFEGARDAPEPFAVDNTDASSAKRVAHAPADFFGRE